MCPRSLAFPVLLFVGLFLCRRLRNSWWTCHCLRGCGWLSGPMLTAGRGLVHGGLLVPEGHQAHPVDPPGAVHRQSRAVYKYWARLRRALASGCRSPCEHQRQVPAVQGVLPVGASDPVHLQSVGHSCCGAETSTHSSAQLCRRPEISPGAVLGGCRRARCCATTGLWFRQCRKQLQFIDVGSIRCDHAAPSSNSSPYAALSGVFVLFNAFFGLRPFGR